MVYNTADNNYGVAKWIVDPTAGSGTHTTIATAITSASSGDTIFIRPGTYTENITLKAGVDLTAFGCDSSLNGTGHVIISGTCTMTTAGSVTIAGIQLQTNSAALLVVSGSVASVVNLNNCYLNCTNTTGITFSSSSASATINMYKCYADVGTTGITLFSQTSIGILNIYYCRFTTSGSTLTASTCSAGSVVIFNTASNIAITSSSTGSLAFFYTDTDVAAFNLTAVTAGGSGNHLFVKSCFFSGTASAVSISQTVTMLGCCVGSSNTNCITGAGTLNYSDMTFQNTSSTINVTTQTGGTLQGGKFQAPSAGYLGEQFRSFAGSISLTSTQAKTVTSINLTAGIWDISGVIFYSSGAGTVSTAQQGSISATNNAIGSTYGDDIVAFVVAAGIANLQTTQVIPALRVTLTAAATYYLVAVGTFTVSTLSCAGRISATRVG